MNNCPDDPEPCCVSGGAAMPPSRYRPKKRSVRSLAAGLLRELEERPDLASRLSAVEAALAERYEAGRKAGRGAGMNIARKRKIRQ